jgi:hypothetical protein
MVRLAVVGLPLGAVPVVQLVVPIRLVARLVVASVVGIVSSLAILSRTAKR